MVLNIEKIGNDSYYTYHNENHSKKMCPQWNHLASRITVQFVDSVMVEEQSKPDEKEEEVDADEEDPSIRHVVNMYNCFLTA